MILPFEPEKLVTLGWAIEENGSTVILRKTPDEAVHKDGSPAFLPLQTMPKAPPIVARVRLADGNLHFNPKASAAHQAVIASLTNA